MRPQRAHSAGHRRDRSLMLLGLFLWAGAGWGTRCPAADAPSNADRCARIVQAEVVAIDQCVIYNRYGTALPNGMIYALRRDVVSNDGPAKTRAPTRRRDSPRRQTPQADRAQGQRGRLPRDPLHESAGDGQSGERESVVPEDSGGQRARPGSGGRGLT